jgi:micrococcal nuclease
MKAKSSPLLKFLVVVIGLLTAVSLFAQAELESQTYLPYVKRVFMITASATATILPNPSVTATAVATPTAILSTPISPPPVCQTCVYDAYNCADFSTHLQAQACYEYCLQQVGTDVHRLDGDHDGLACENLP